MKYLIDFHHGVTEEQIDAYLDEYGYTFLQEWDNFERIVLVETDVEPVKTDLVEFIVRDDHLEIRPQMAQSITVDPYHCSLNVPGLPDLVISTTDEKDWWKNYVLPEPDFDNPSVTISRKGQNVSVYIMDSGINLDHPEFEDVNITNVYTITENDFTDSVGHGTAVASIISGKTCGITAADIKVVKIFRPDRGTYQSEFISALDAIINDFEPNSYAVVNCSWSIPRNQYIEDKLRLMIFQGLYVVAAAGNSGLPIDNVTPAAMDEVITIGSYSPDLVPSSFSSYTGGSIISYTENDVNHGELDGWAPGERIWVADASNNSYGYSAGTSLACAVASAVAVYNLSDYLDSTGHRLQGTENYMLPNNRFILFQRPNLLDLTDPKYQNSLNYVATLLNQYLYENKGISTGPAVLVCYAGKGKQIVGSVLNIISTKEALLLDELPDFFWTTKDGFLWADPPAGSNINSITGENYVIVEFKLSITYNDDQNITKNIKVYILSENLNPEDYPEDSEIQVTLLTGCTNGFVPSCVPGRGSPGCYDDGCGFGTQCCQTIVKNTPCACGMFG